MSLTEAVRTRIDDVVQNNPVVLFMKGDRQQPQCGFSATVIGILESVGPQYTTVNVLEDPEIREGIKAYSEWPTIPQLYIDGEFVGGCDLVQQMYGAGELHQALGKEVVEVTPPTITVSDAAAEAIREVQSQHQQLAVHLKIDAAFNHEFSMAPAKGFEIAASANGIDILFDRDSAARAEGLAIDMVESADGPGFSIDNPNAPAPVAQMTAQELKSLLDAGEPVHLFDVREPAEREIASIAGSVLLDDAVVKQIDGFERNTLMVFQCHSGVRSQSAADYFRAQGFTNVHNLAGGIDAWSREVDSSVPRY